MRGFIVSAAAVTGLILSLSAATAQSAPSFTYTLFDVQLPGANNTKPFAIDPQGNIVGRYWDALGNPHGFIRNPGGSITAPIDVPVSSTGTVLRGIDATGDIVGRYFDPAGGTHGFLFPAGGGFVSFDVPEAFGPPGNTVANDINNRGQIAGHYDAPTPIPGYGAPMVSHGFLRNPDGTFVRVDYPTANVTMPTGINDRGEVAGVYYQLDPVHPQDMFVHGFVRAADGTYTTVDVPASTGAVASGFSRINEEGGFVGLYGTSPVTVFQLSSDEPFLGGTGFWMGVNGSLATISIPNAVLTSPLGLNPQGTVVGQYLDAGLQSHGFLASR